MKDKNLKKLDTTYGLLPTAYGFTLLELLLVIFITGLLTAVVTVNFSHQRNQQELQNANNELISKIREVQSWVTSGRQVTGGQAADAYEITFTAGSQTYAIDYFIDSAKTNLETVALPQNIEARQLLAGSSLSSLAQSSPVILRMEAPFGRIKVNNNPSWSAEIVLAHKTANLTRSAVVDGISGRIGAK